MEDFIIITSSKKETVENDVKSNLRRGYRILGSLSVILNAGGETVFSISMIRAAD
jgi:hypothetical protein